MIARELKKCGHTVHVMKQMDLADARSLGQDKFYDVHLVGHLPHGKVVNVLRRFPHTMKRLMRIVHQKVRILKFYLMVQRLSHAYDIVHIHSVWFVALLLPLKQKLFLFHGDDVRWSPSCKGAVYMILTRVFLWVFAHTHQLGVFYVSTPDLTSEVPRSQWIPNPVDIQHFMVSHSAQHMGEALYIHNWYETDEYARKVATAHGWNLSILDRVIDDYIPYSVFPQFLAQYNIFIDRHVIQSLSKTALEALALGLKVVRYDGKIVEGLPPEHLAENVANEWLHIYREMLHV